MDAEGEGPQALKSRPSAALTADILNKFGYFMIGTSNHYMGFSC
jgi:hypothetical protein